MNTIWMVVIGFGVWTAATVTALLVVMGGARRTDCTCDSDYEDFNERPCVDCD